MHDCQEFFVCFLEALQEELNNKEKLNIPEKASMEQKWIIYRKVNNSFIDSIFTGLMRSCVQCKKCNFKSYTYDPFIDLSVSINKYKNLEKCLKQYFENEKIDCEYKCDNCKQISKVSINILNFYFFLKFYI
jgi:ubiquitin C-terminal hydrolase